MRSLQTFGQPDKRLIYDENFIAKFEFVQEIFALGTRVEATTELLLKSVESVISLGHRLPEGLQQNLSNSLNNYNLFVQLLSLNASKEKEEVDNKLWQLPDPPTQKEIDKLQSQRVAPFLTSLMCEFDEALHNQFGELFYYKIRVYNMNVVDERTQKFMNFLELELSGKQLVQQIFENYTNLCGRCTVADRELLKLMTNFLNQTCLALGVRFNPKVGHLVYIPNID